MAKGKLTNYAIRFEESFFHPFHHLVEGKKLERAMNRHLTGSQSLHTPRTSPPLRLEALAERITNRPVPLAKVNRTQTFLFSR